jgi:hypothetical protein
MVVTMVRPMEANCCSFSTSEYDVDESNPILLRETKILVACARVGSTGGGLVEEEDRRVSDHLHSDTHPLPLSARDASVLGIANLGLLALLQPQLSFDAVSAHLETGH